MGEASAHAVLSPSAAKRWMACTPSARFEQQFENVETIFAKEGTLAHAISEAMLKGLLGVISQDESESLIKEYMTDELFTAEMMTYCQQYVDFCMWKAQGEAITGVEIKLDTSRYIPEGSGTGDFNAVLRKLKRLVFADLKYGKGVPVFAENNPQLKIYGLAALDWFEWLYDISDIEVVELNIFQPRINNTSTWEISVVDLRKWAETELAPKAELAFKGEGQFNPGEHCKFCRARVRCQALADHNLDLFKHELKSHDQLTDAALLEIVKKSSLLTSWAKDIEEYVLSEAVKGKKWEGMKLVEGKSNRVFVSEAMTEQKLLSAGHTEIYTPKELLGVTKLKSKLGAKVFKELVESDLRKPPGKPTLVDINDPRADYDNAIAVFKDAEVREEVE